MSEGNYYSKHLYQRSSKNTEDLEKNVSEYPFSSLASFLLLYHYKKTAHPEFENFAQKTVLHFSNPRWLQFILFEKSAINEIEAVTENNTPQEIEEHYEFNIQSPVEFGVTENFAEEINEEKIIEEKKEETPDTEIIDGVAHEENGIKAESVAEIFHEQNVQPEFESSQTHQGAQPPPFIQKTTPIENQTPDDTKEIIAFDPLHTVDYFASQGIKLTEEELITNDKLGTQMKSFTAWLKSMKKLHSTKLTEQGIVSENLIQTSAEESNINTEILTEAMAEVLIKQDKKEKAIDMFNKLSLINPAKSAYFAAKIESIKIR
jgi:hypothetical protein